LQQYFICVGYILGLEHTIPSYVSERQLGGATTKAIKVGIPANLPKNSFLFLKWRKELKLKEFIPDCLELPVFVYQIFQAVEANMV